MVEPQLCVRDFIWKGGVCSFSFVWMQYSYKLCSFWCCGVYVWDETAGKVGRCLGWIIISYWRSSLKRIAILDTAQHQLVYRCLCLDNRNCTAVGLFSSNAIVLLRSMGEYTVLLLGDYSFSQRQQIFPQKVKLGWGYPWIGRNG